MACWKGYRTVERIKKRINNYKFMINYLEVKNKEGDLMHLEKYHSKISDIRFSYGVCDNYMEKHFPDVIEVWNKKDFFEEGQKRFLDS